MTYDVVVIGGGAAGMMAAGKAAEMGRRVLLVEKNKILGKKLLITGKGRCNVTNNCSVSDLIKNIPVNSNFMYSAFARFGSDDTISFFEGLGIPLKTERGNRVFPASDRSADIVSALKKYIDKSGVKAINGNVTEIMVDEGVVVGVKLKNNEIINCQSVIVATGGKSYSQTGSTGDGYALSMALGHTVTDISPSLVPLNTKQQFPRDAQGLSLKNVTLTAYEGEKKEIYSELGEMLFTHFGITGPLVLSASSHMRDFKNKSYYVVVDLKPALSEETLDRRILRDFEEFNKKEFANSLNLLLPQKLIPVVVKLSGIKKDKKVSDITKEERQSLVNTIKNLRMDISSPRDIDEAIVTSGGIITKEINPKTMESKLVAGLYFAGEVIDVDAYTGGFNLQIAFATGFVAGENA